MRPQIETKGVLNEKFEDHVRDSGIVLHIAGGRSRECWRKGLRAHRAASAKIRGRETTPVLPRRRLGGWLLGLEWQKALLGGGQIYQSPPRLCICARPVGTPSPRMVLERGLLVPALSSPRLHPLLPLRSRMIGKAPAKALCDPKLQNFAFLAKVLATEPLGKK